MMPYDSSRHQGSDTLQTINLTFLGYHGTLGYYVALATEHYCCMTCFIPSTCSEGIANTIQFFPQKIDFPALTSNDHFLTALDKITTILHSKAFQRNNNVLQVDMSTQKALELITKHLHRSATFPTATPVTTASSSFSQSLSLTSLEVSQVPMVEDPQVTPRDIPSTRKIHTALPRVGTSLPVSASRGPQQPASRVSPICTAAQHTSIQYHRHVGFMPASLKQLPRYFKVHLLKSISHIYHKETGKKMTLRALFKDSSTTEIWSHLASNEFGQLMNGNRYGVISTQAMTTIKPSAIFQDKTITFASMVCDYRPLKQEIYRCHLVAGVTSFLMQVILRFQPPT